MAAQASLRYSLDVAGLQNSPREANPSRGATENKKDSSKSLLDLNRWVPAIPAAFRFAWLYSIPLIWIMGIFVILIYVSQLPSAVRWTAFATAVVIGASAELIGGLAGFLFGVPREVQNPAASTTQTYQGNTNLEQVSDWLTKIIVGVSLVEIGRAIPTLTKFAASMKAPLGGQASSGAFGLGLVITNALLGFFYLYLWSRSLFKAELEYHDISQSHSSTETGTQLPDTSSVKNKPNS